MLHGNPSWSFYYRRLALELRKDYRVIAPDHMGCGLSDKPQDYSYTLGQHIENVERLCERHSLQNITLIMHDWGGPIGLGYAVRRPETVSRLVLLNTVGFSLPSIPWYLKLCATKTPGAFLVRRLNLFARVAARIGCRESGSMDPLVRKGFLSPYGTYRDRIAIHRFIQDIPRSAEHPSFQELKNVENGLALLKDLPILLLWGKKDPVFKESCLPVWKSHFPNAAQVLFDRGGHYLAEDCHQGVTKSIRAFLNASHPSSTGHAHHAGNHK